MRRSTRQRIANPSCWLAFQIATERGNPASMMCAYNKINGVYACGNDPILNGVIKQAIGFKGFIMSDWKAVYNWDYALKGLDMHSGVQLDKQEWFVGPLRQAYKEAKVPKETRFGGAPCRHARSGSTGNRAAEERRSAAACRIGEAYRGNRGKGQRRRDGGGSSQVIPPGGFALQIPLGGEGLLGGLRRQVFIAPGPLASLKKLLPDTEIIYDSGEYPAGAATLARRVDVVILVANKFEGEGFDSPDLTLPDGQDALIAAVAAANPNTIVLLQTGTLSTCPGETV